MSLVCSDNQIIEAHKVILSSASNFFRFVFTEYKHSHPLIYMRNVKVKEITAILDFIYNGEVFIDQQDQNEFLKLSEELEIKGLRAKFEENNIEKSQSGGKVERREENIIDNIVENTIQNLEEYTEEKPTFSEYKTISIIHKCFSPLLLLYLIPAF